MLSGYSSSWHNLFGHEQMYLNKNKPWIWGYKTSDLRLFTTIELPPIYDSNLQDSCGCHITSCCSTRGPTWGQVDTDVSNIVEPSNLFTLFQQLVPQTYIETTIWLIFVCFFLLLLLLLSLLLLLLSLLLSLLLLLLLLLVETKTGAPCNIQGFVLFCEACNLIWHPVPELVYFCFFSFFPFVVETPPPSQQPRGRSLCLQAMGYKQNNNQAVLALVVVAAAVMQQQEEE